MNGRVEDPGPRRTRFRTRVVSAPRSQSGTRSAKSDPNGIGHQCGDPLPPPFRPITAPIGNREQRLDGYLPPIRPTNRGLRATLASHGYIWDVGQSRQNGKKINVMRTRTACDVQIIAAGGARSRDQNPLGFDFHDDSRLRGRRAIGAWGSTRTRRARAAFAGEGAGVRGDHCVEQGAAANRTAASACACAAARFRSFRFLCFRIFLRRHLTTLPTGVSRLVPRPVPRRGSGKVPVHRASVKRCPFPAGGGLEVAVPGRRRPQVASWGPSGACRLPRRRRRPRTRLIGLRRERKGRTGRFRTPRVRHSRSRSASVGATMRPRRR